MQNFRKLQFLTILATLLVAACNPYGAKGRDRTKYSQEENDGYEIESEWKGFDQEKRPTERGNGHRENIAIKFRNGEYDYENNDHLGSHGLGTGVVQHDSKHDGSGDNSYDFPVQENDHTLNRNNEEDDNHKHPGRNYKIPKEDDRVYTTAEEKYDSEKKDIAQGGLDSNEKDPGLFENFGTILQGLKKKIEALGNKAEKKIIATQSNLRNSYEGFKEATRNILDKIADKFRKLWGRVDRFVERGSQYVFKGIARAAYDEAKGSQLIAKLAQRLLDGDKVVDKFFKKVGEKVSQWLQQHGHDNVDEGLYAPQREVEEQFLNPQFPNIFQDLEIHQELDKLVQSGIMEQEEVDELSKILIIPKDNKIKVLENSSVPFPDDSEDQMDHLKYSEKEAAVMDAKPDFLKKQDVDDPSTEVTSESVEPVLPSYISKQLKAWVNSIDKLVSE